MGIRGLYSFVHWSASKVIHKEPLAKWAGKRLGVDILCLLYRSRSIGIPLVWNISQLIASCKKYNIQLTVVFDGSPPPEKAKIMDIRKKQREDTDKYCSALESAIEKNDLSDEQKSILQERISISRRNVPQVKSEDRDLVKQLLYATGTPFVHSNGEADVLLSWMAHQGFIDAVVSTDYDFLARGVRNLLVPSSEDLSSLSFFHFELPSICQEIGFTEKQFKEFSCLLGTDYAQGVGKFTSRLLYRRFRLCGSIDILMDRLQLSQEKRTALQCSLQELNVEGLCLDELLRPDQQKKLFQPSSVENDWILRNLQNGDICGDMQQYVLTYV